MTQPHDIAIDRIVVTDVPLAHEWAEVVRRAVETELARALEKRGPGGAAPAGRIEHVQTALPEQRGRASASGIAADVAHSVADVIRNVC